MFYNSYRTTKAANAERLKLGQTGKSVISNPRERLMNIQKREKLKTLLITKFMQKYGIKRPEQYLENEINKFLQGEKLNNNDLQKLDAKIHRILIENKGFSNLQDTLNASLSQNTIPHQNNESIYPNNQIPNMNINLTEENINQNYSKSNADILSFNKYPKFKNPREELAWLEAEEAKYSKKGFNEVKKDNNINNKSNEYPPQIDFSTFDDEWAALAEYNRRMYLQDIKEEKIKEHESKEKEKITFIGNELLLGLYDYLSKDYNDSEFVIEKDMKYDVLKNTIQSKINDKSLSYNVVIALDSKLELSKDQYNEIIELLKDYKIYIIDSNTSIDKENVTIIDIEKIMENEKNVSFDNIHLTDDGNKELKKIIDNYLKKENTNS